LRMRSMTRWACGCMNHPSRRNGYWRPCARRRMPSRLTWLKASIPQTHRDFASMGVRFGLKGKVRSGMLWILRGGQLLSKQEEMI